MLRARSHRSPGVNLDSPLTSWVPWITFLNIPEAHFPHVTDSQVRCEIKQDKAHSMLSTALHNELFLGPAILNLSLSL